MAISRLITFSLLGTAAIVALAIGLFFRLRDPMVFVFGVRIVVVAWVVVGVVALIRRTPARA